MAHVEQHPKAESGKREYSLGVPLSAFHARDRSLPKRVWYAYLHVICRLLAVGILRFRCRGREHLPRSGGALLLANHQSYFDPLIVGLTCDRPIAAIARKTLFRFPPFRWLIESLDAIPIDRGRPTLGEIKQILARLKRGQIILMFPEGTRTSDGRIGPLNAGFCSLARRAGVPIVVMAIDGAYDAWPKLRALPQRACVHVAIAPPLSAEQIAALDDAALLASVDRLLRQAHAAIRQERRRAEPP